MELPFIERFEKTKRNGLKRWAAGGQKLSWPRTKSWMPLVIPAETLAND